MKGCEECDGGLRWVTPHYAELLFPFPDGATEAEIEATWERRTLYGQAVYPCRNCLPSQFYRWVNGCNRPDHLPTECDLCREAMGDKGAARAERAATGGFQSL